MGGRGAGVWGCRLPYAISRCLCVLVHCVCGGAAGGVRKRTGGRMAADGFVDVISYV